jgi:glycerophosphoryl diester phosphodiesterase
MGNPVRRRRRKLIHRSCQIVRSLLGTVTVLILGAIVYVYLPRSLPPMPPSFTLIAHRAISQTFPLDNLKNDTCTAKIIDPPTHRFLENTLPAIREAFRQGADMVEIDIHPTIDNQLAVFHDWILECRTNGRGVTHEQSMTALKKLDIGYGYTTDGGKTYPFRGMGVGLMPTFDEVIQAFPNQKILVDQKDTFEKTVRLLAHSLENYPTSQRENIYLFSGEDQYELLKRDIPEVKKIFPTRQEAKACVTEYLTMIVSGAISPACGKYALGIPVKYLKYIPGWPSFFLSQAHRASLEIYVIEVDTPEDLAKVKGLPIAGIVTNRIEIMGPLLDRSKIVFHQAKAVSNSLMRLASR